MKIHFLVLLILAFSLLHSKADTYPPEYTKAATVAAIGGDQELVEQLVKHGADPNGVVANGHSLLTYACRQSYGPDSTVKARLSHVKFLIAKGAKVNAVDSLGVVPLLAAERAGSKDLIALLKQSGAMGLDSDDPKVKAAAILLDGEILQELLDRLCVEDVSKYGQTVIPYDALKIYTANTTLKVAQANGRDLFGRPFVLSTKYVSIVTVDPETVKELGKGNVIKADYWKGLSE